jgi:hypothetical protein
MVHSPFAAQFIDHRAQPWHPSIAVVAVTVSSVFLPLRITHMSDAERPIARIFDLFAVYDESRMIVLPLA